MRSEVNESLNLLVITLSSVSEVLFDLKKLGYVAEIVMTEESIDIRKLEKI